MKDKGCWDVQNGHLKGSNISQHLEKKKPLKKRPLSSPGTRPPEKRITPQSQPSRDTSKGGEQQTRPSPLKGTAAEKSKRSAPSSQSRENVAETEGEACQCSHSISYMSKLLTMIGFPNSNPNVPATVETASKNVSYERIPQGHKYKLDITGMSHDFHCLYDKFLY